MCDLIIQSLRYGNVCKLLNENLVTVEEILCVLAKLPASILTLGIYRYICTLTDLHYVEGKHFLWIRPEYWIIFDRMQMDSSIPDTKGGNNPLYARLTDLNTVCSISISNGIFYESDDESVMSDDDLQIIEPEYHTPAKITEYPNSLKEVRAYALSIYPPKNSHIFCQIAMDYLQEVCEIRHASAMIKRVYSLSEQAPTYLEAIKKDYELAFKNLMQNGILCYASSNMILKISKYFPKVIPEEIAKFDTLTRRICLMQPIYMNYFLGLNPEFTYTTTEICEIASKLNENTDSFLLSLNNKKISVNDEDVLAESITSYFPCDIVTLRTNSKVYCFSRREVESLIQSKKNHWTNEILSECFQRFLSSYYEFTLLFPPCKTMREHYKEILEKKCDVIYIDKDSRNFLVCDRILYWT